MTDFTAKQLKDLIIKAQDIKTEPVVVSEWKDAEGKPITVYLKQASAYEKDKFEEDNRGSRGSIVNMRAKMIIQYLVDKDGNRIFDDSPKDIAYLSSKSGAAIERLMDKVLELNSVTNEDLEQIAKN